MARKQPSRPAPTGLSETSQAVKPIPRPDRTEIAPGGGVVDPARIPKTLDRIGPRTRSSPIGQDQSSAR